MVYYYPDKSECKKDDFVDYYSKMYFYFQKDDKEDSIYELFKGELSKDEVLKILEWKTGAKAKDYVIKVRNNTIELKKDFEKITYDENAKNFLDKIKNIDGVGSTYMITLLFFASKGEYPIYDQFADKALWAIKEDKKPHSKVDGYKVLPDKKSNYFSKYKDDKDSYCNRLNEVAKDLNEEYKGCTNEYRRIDRALWVYGHMFK